MLHPESKNLEESSAFHGAALNQISNNIRFEANQSNIIVCFDSNIVNKESATPVAISIVSEPSVASNTASGGVV